MKKTLLSACLISFSVAAFAQDGIEIHYNGAGPDISGGTHEVNLYASSPDVTPIDANTVLYEAHFDVTNNTGSDQQWRITRWAMVMPSTWPADQLCWPPLCYNATGEFYITPSSQGNPAPIVVNGTDQTTNSELAEIKPRITIDVNNASYAHFRYYVTDAIGGNYVDSVDLTINFTLGVNSPKLTPALSLAPNPANDQLNLTLSNTSGTVKIVDVLGNVVYMNQASEGSNPINTSNFRNGVYFVTVEGIEGKSLTRKLIVKH
ncbi:MAG: T9SS type A sorting domain-containing protein [Bacteroidetes bacterium]|nr:MAG: T9SS type A sorting domain-containing protein [Bacteroidota bacterium]